MSCIIRWNKRQKYFESIIFLVTFQYFLWYHTLVIFRWHDEKISALQLSAPLSVLPTLSVDQAITIMNEEGYDQLPVIDESG